MAHHKITVPLDELADTLNRECSDHPPEAVAPLPGGKVQITLAAAHQSERAFDLNDYSDEQAKVIKAVTDTDSGDVLVIAGPGSGKTRTLIGAIKALVASGKTSGEKLAAISFTNNSAAELLVRLFRDSSGDSLSSLKSVHVSTFHAWVGELAALHVQPWREPPILLSEPALALALHLKNPDTETHVFSRSEIAAADRHMEGCETFQTMRDRNFNQIQEKDHADNLQAFKNLETATTDLATSLSDVQMDTYGTLMRRGIKLARTLPQGALDWVFVDEAQDMNSVQRDFIMAIKEATGCRIFAIADDDQGIYKFRGAGNSFLIEMLNSPGTHSFQLGTNYRSTRSIVDTCVAWVRPNWEGSEGQEKPLCTNRTGLPVVLLTAPESWKRGQHARIILDAAKKQGLLEHLGEAAALSFSPNRVPFDVEKAFSKDEINQCGDLGLPEEVWNGFKEALGSVPDNGGWHHSFWADFVNRIQAGEWGDFREGCPGLGSLYATLEVVRRLQPDSMSKAFRKALQQAVIEVNCSFQEDRPVPDYTDEKINLLSLHSSKGMEFRVVWLTGAGFAFGEKPGDQNEGQPNVQVIQTLFSFVKKVFKQPQPARTPEEIQELNRKAIRQENRRLIYVGMSRATDLLLISMPSEEGEEDWQIRDRAFAEAFDEAIAKLDDSYIVRIGNKNQAKDFAREICAERRNLNWEAPKRYRIESFTSLTRQVLPGEERSIEQPPGMQVPRPQSRQAMIGDQFHRIMHLLCLEPDTLARRLDGEIGNQDLIDRVRHPEAEALPELETMLESYFGDTEQRPWEWLKNAKSEVPFRHVIAMKSESGEEEPCVIKGFIDLVQFDKAGKPFRIVDYKTGGEPKSEETRTKYQEQLKMYCEALEESYALQDGQIEGVNYFFEE